jgi:hypothetical protein
MAPTHEHLEHAEHAQHAAHDPFDRRVAMTIALVAAALAAVTMLSHRSHNQTLQLQGDANRARIDASNAWAQYQAKRLRQAQYEMLGEMLPLVAAGPDASQGARKDVCDKWKAQAARYKKELEEITEKAKGYEAEAETAIHASHLAHVRGDRFDVAELAVEFGLVLCSIAVLTKRKLFWGVGAVSGLIGVVVACSVLTLNDVPHGHGDDQHHEAPAEKSAGGGGGRHH